MISLADKIPLRADALKNRERILAAAEEMFIERGATVTLDEVAKRAGVGIGTLYRRFPTREDLLAAAYSARFVAFAESSRAKEAELGPLEGLRAYLEELVRYTNMYRGFAASLGTVLQIETEGCRATSDQGARLLENAQKAGVMRPDIRFGDLVCTAMAISLATERDDSAHANIVRLVNIFIEGFATARPSDLGPGVSRVA